MLRKTSELFNFKLGAVDGEIGHLKDFYFEDQGWTLRYLVADTGNWLPGRQILLSPCALKALDESAQVAKFDLTVQQIENSPSIDADKPVTRQHEVDYAKYYGWPVYSYGPVFWGPVPHPVYDRTDPGAPSAEPLPPEQTADPHLRSTNEIIGYHIQAKNGEIGHVEDFIVDTREWVIRYLVIDTRNWWPGKRVLISPAWIREITWEDAKAHVDLDREVIQGAPEYDPDTAIMRPYENRLFEYYGREAYWNKQPHSVT